MVDVPPYLPTLGITLGMIPVNAEWLGGTIKNCVSAWRVGGTIMKSVYVGWVEGTMVSTGWVGGTILSIVYVGWVVCERYSKGCVCCGGLEV